MSAMGDMPWFIPGPMKGARELCFKTIHIDPSTARPRLHVEGTPATGTSS